MRSGILRRSAVFLFLISLMSFCYYPRNRKDWLSCNTENVVVSPDSPIPTRFFRGRTYLTGVDDELRSGDLDSVERMGDRFVGFYGLVVGPRVPVEAVRKLRKRGREVFVSVKLGESGRVHFEEYDGVVVRVGFGKVEKGKFVPPDPVGLVREVEKFRREQGLKGKKVWVLLLLPPGFDAGKYGEWVRLVNGVGALAGDDWTVVCKGSSGGFFSRFPLGEPEGSLSVGDDWAYRLYAEGVLCLARSGAVVSVEVMEFSHLCDEESGECLAAWDGVYDVEVEGKVGWGLKVLVGEKKTRR